MKLGGYLRLIRQNAGRKIAAKAAAAAGIAAGIAALTFFLSLGAGVKDALAGRDSRRLPANVVEVFPSSLSFGLFRLGGDSLLPGSRMTEADVRKIASIPGVTGVSPTLNLNIPAMADISYLGRTIRTDLIVTGLREEMAGPAVVAGGQFRFEAGKPVPAILNNNLLDLYNTTYAAANNLPKLSESAVAGLGFRLTLGRSFLNRKGVGKPFETDAVIAGFSPRAVLIGITLPYDFVARLNGQFGMETASYRSVFVEAADPSAIPEIVKGVQTLGFTIEEGSRKLLDTIGFAVSIITAVLALAGISITAVAALAISLILFMNVEERRHEIGIMRAVGATRANIRNVFILEAAIIGAACGTLGGAAGFAISAAGNYAAGSLLRGFPIRPETLFVFSPWLFPSGVLLALALCVAGAMPPAVRASRLDPARAMAN